MAEPLTFVGKAVLEEKLSSASFNAARNDILNRTDPVELKLIGQSLLTDMLKVEPQLPFIRKMIEASPGIVGRVAAVVDGRKCDPEQIFTFFGEAAIIAQTLDIETLKGRE